MLSCEGEIPIDELLKQYSAAEMEESTDIQSDDESVDELSSEGELPDVDRLSKYQSNSIPLFHLSHTISSW